MKRILAATVALTALMITGLGVSAQPESDRGRNQPGSSEAGQSRGIESGRGQRDIRGQDRPAAAQNERGRRGESGIEARERVTQDRKAAGRGVHGNRVEERLSAGRHQRVEGERGVRGSVSVSGERRTRITGRFSDRDDAGSYAAQRREHIVDGRPYCFYFDGWHGAGWYRCGFAQRSGAGWGGVYGWRSWVYGPAERRFHAGVGTRERTGRLSEEGGTRIRERTTVREGARIRGDVRVGGRDRETIREGARGRTDVRVGGRERETIREGARGRADVRVGGRERETIGEGRRSRLEGNAGARGGNSPRGQTGSTEGRGGSESNTGRGARSPERSNQGGNSGRRGGSDGENPR